MYFHCKDWDLTSVATFFSYSRFLFHFLTFSNYRRLRVPCVCIFSSRRILFARLFERVRKKYRPVHAFRQIKQKRKTLTERGKTEANAKTRTRVIFLRFFSFRGGVCAARCPEAQRAHPRKASLPKLDLVQKSNCFFFVEQKLTQKNRSGRWCWSAAEIFSTNQRFQKRMNLEEWAGRRTRIWKIQNVSLKIKYLH